MTIYDIAEKAGVSASTVSRVINGRYGVKESTRAKVQALLDESNFVVSESARGLVNQSNKLIGILLSDIRNQHYNTGAWEMERFFAAKGYMSLIINAGHTDGEKAECLRSLVARGVDALVLIGSTFSCEAVAGAISTWAPSIPVVMQNGGLDLPNVSSVTAREAEGIADAVRFFHGQGRRRIVFCKGPGTPSNRLKEEGYLDGMAELGLEPVLFSAGDSFRDGYGAAGEILSSCPDVDAVIFALDMQAVGASRHFHDNGVPVPERISFCGVDNSPFLELCTPKVSSVDTSLPEMARRCSEILWEMMGAPGWRADETVPASLVHHETTAP